MQEGLISGMNKVGLRFENGEFFMPEMLVAARTMQVALNFNFLRPLLIDAGVTPIGEVVIGTVQGDLHDIGKNLVGMMLKKLALMALLPTQGKLQSLHTHYLTNDIRKIFTE